MSSLYHVTVESVRTVAIVLGNTFDAETEDAREDAVASAARMGEGRLVSETVPDITEVTRVLSLVSKP